MAASSELTGAHASAAPLLEVGQDHHGRAPIARAITARCSCALRTHVPPQPVAARALLPHAPPQPPHAPELPPPAAPCGAEDCSRLGRHPRMPGLARMPFPRPPTHAPHNWLPASPAHPAHASRRLPTTPPVRRLWRHVRQQGQNGLLHWILTPFESSSLVLVN